jgi:hypothetical protein
VGSLLSQLLPTAVVGAVAPLPITVVITLLMSEGGLAKALGFAAALIGAFAAIGAVTLATANTNAGSSEKGGAITGTLGLGVGVWFLVKGITQIS